MKLSSRTRQNWILIFGFAAATAAGCSVHVLPGVGSTGGGGGAGSLGGGAPAGSGASCTPTCDCHTFCANAAPCYPQNFDMSWCLDECENHVPGDLRQAVCDADSCDAVHLAEDNTWYGPGSCAPPWTGGGDASLDECLSCWEWASQGACVLNETAYEADGPAVNLDTCIDLHHYTTSSIIACQHEHPNGVVKWDANIQCSVCGVCPSACVGTDLFNYVCGSDESTSTN